MHNAIQTRALTKSFNNFTAVDQVDLEVPVGSIYGYLGANGAGKTTTIRMLLDLIRPDSGSLEILGHKMPESFSRFANKIGVVPGEIRLYEELTGRETLDYFQGFLQSKPILRENLLRDLKLKTSDLDKKVRYYSQGMKQKLLLIQAMQHNPDLLILDEPSERLDPLIQQVLYKYINEFSNQGKTVFFSSHNLPEVEKICDHIGIIKDGKLLVQERIEDLKSRLPRQVIVKFNGHFKIADFKKIPGLSLIAHSKNTLEMSVEGELGPLLHVLKDYDVSDLDFPESSLEHFFMTYYRDNNGRTE
ncbi:MAG: ABC transporter ATP-binding protein [Calditrichae bacterium]|nr:ABC transporter ATP-binding protein [Calditrichota bacterium]MCB9059426.1 ABC transporter ATP-binding protein [Calditrichia bacterium]